MSPVPKPSYKKKQKKYNGYKDKPDRICYYTGAYGAERHEVYGGPNRQISIDHGFQVDLSPEIHARFHDPRTEEDLQMIKYWKEKCQRDFETGMIDNGFTPLKAREAFIALIGRNYLELED